MRTSGVNRILFSIGAIQVLIMLIGLIRSKTLSWLLGPDGFGVASTMDQVALSVVQLGSLGLQFTALRFMSAAHSEGPAAFSRAYSGFLRILVWLSLLVALFALALVEQYPALFGRDLAKYRALIRIAILGVPPAMLNMFFMNALAAGQRSGAAATLNLIFSFTAAAAATAGFLLYGMTGLFAASAAAVSCVVAGSAYYVRRTLDLPAAPRGPSASLPRSPALVSDSMLLYIAICAYALTMLVIRYSVISGLGETEAGWFQASLGIALSLGAVISPMNNLYLIPLMNRRIPANEKIAAAHDFTRKTMALGLLAALPLVLFPRFFATLLYTGRFQPIASTLFLFVAWQSLALAVGVYHQVLIGLQDILYFCVTICLGYGLAASLSPVLIPEMGLRGAALALSAGSLFMWIASVLRLRIRHAAPLPADVILLCAYCVSTILLPALIPPSAGEFEAIGLTIRLAYWAAAAAGLWLVAGDENRRLAATLRTRVVTAFADRPGGAK